MSRLYILLAIFPMLVSCSSQPETGVVPIELSEHSAAVTVSIDGEVIELSGVRPAVEMAIGSHQLRVEGNGYRAINRELIVSAGQNDLVRIELIPNEPTTDISRKADMSPHEAVTNVDQSRQTPPQNEGQPTEKDNNLQSKEPKTIRDSGTANIDLADSKDTNELTPREKEVADWVVSVGGTLVQGEGLGVVLGREARYSVDDFSKFQDLPNLHTLLTAGWHEGPIDAKDLTDAHILQLRNLPNLSVFGAQGANIGDKSLEHLATFPLRSLLLYGTGATDDGIGLFKRHEFIQFHILGSPGVSDKGLRDLDFTGTVDIRLGDTIVSDVFALGLSKCRRLKYLGLDRTRVTGNGIASLREVDSLVMLILKGLDLDDRHLRYFEGNQSLQNLSLDGTSVSRNGLQFVAETFPKLTRLSAAGVQLQPGDDVTWSLLQNLKAINLSVNPIGVRQLEELSRLPDLIELQISANKYLGTLHDFRRFQSSNPNCRINEMTIDEFLIGLNASGR